MDCRPKAVPLVLVERALEQFDQTVAPYVPDLSVQPVARRGRHALDQTEQRAQRCQLVGDLRVPGGDEGQSLGLGDGVVAVRHEVLRLAPEHAGQQGDRPFAGHREPGLDVRQRHAGDRDALG